MDVYAKVLLRTIKWKLTLQNKLHVTDNFKTKPQQLHVIATLNNLLVLEDNAGWVKEQAQFFWVTIKLPSHAHGRVFLFKMAESD